MGSGLRTHMAFRCLPRASCLLMHISMLALLAAQPAHAGSTCYGTTSDGRIEGAVKLPASGENFEAYSSVLRLAGRTYVHSDVERIVIAAYRALEQEQPGKVFKYAETGLKKGGEFEPHKTHRNGLSVDFMVPVVDRQGRSVHLPTNVLNKYGYAIEFDAQGVFDEYTIDWEAMAAHIVALHGQAVAQGFELWRVIFDPELQPKLLATKYGAYLAENVEFSTRRSWVRHDEHYHVDFEIPCEAEH